MNEYLRSITGKFDLPQNNYLNRISEKPGIPEPNIFDHSSNQYYVALNNNGLSLLAAALNTPEIEKIISRELAEQFNRNSSEYDAAIDAFYNETGIGGSILHHNLDNSHTFKGAMRVLREDFSDDPESLLRLHALEHLARDFTTPSGINPLLAPNDFVVAKAFLTEDLGISRQLANDLLNFNAAELGLSLCCVGTLLFRPSRLQIRNIARQIVRVVSTSFFAGNALGLMAATGILLRIAISEDIQHEQMLEGTIIGAAEMILACALLPALPLSLSLIIGSTVCALGCRLFQGKYNIAVEMEKILNMQFPRYRSYLSGL